MKRTTLIPLAGYLIVARLLCSRAPPAYRPGSHAISCDAGRCQLAPRSAHRFHDPPRVLAEPRCRRRLKCANLAALVN